MSSDHHHQQQHTSSSHHQTSAGGAGGKTVTVEEYSRKFFAKYLGQGYDKTSQSNNLKIAGANFYALLKKLQTAGDREDVKVPLRTLRDEIGNVYATTYPHNLRDSKVEMLFCLFDELNNICTDRLYSSGIIQPEAATSGGGGSSQLAPTASAATNWVILQELRSRVYLLVTGETFDALPQLRLIALERMHKYLVKEWELNRGLTPSSSQKSATEAEQRKKKSSLYGAMANIHASTSQSHVSSKGFGTFISHKVVGPKLESWEALFDDLCKASASKLVPLLRGVLSKLYAAQLEINELKETPIGRGGGEYSGAATAATTMPVKEEEKSTTATAEDGNDDGDVSPSGRKKRIDDAEGTVDKNKTTAEEKETPLPSSDDSAVPRKATTGSIDQTLADLLLLDDSVVLPPPMAALPPPPVPAADPFAASASSLTATTNAPMGPSQGHALDPAFWGPPPQQQQPNQPYYYPRNPPPPYYQQQQQPYGGGGGGGGGGGAGAPQQQQQQPHYPPPSASTNPFLAEAAAAAAAGASPPPHPPPWAYGGGPPPPPASWGPGGGGAPPQQQRSL